MKGASIVIVQTVFEFCILLIILMPFILGLLIFVVFEAFMFIEAFFMNRGADFIASQFISIDLIFYRLRSNGSFLVNKKYENSKKEKNYDIIQERLKNYFALPYSMRDVKTPK